MIKYRLHGVLNTAVLILIGLCLLISPTAFAAAKNTPKAHVLVLNSYEKGFPWTDNIVNGIESVLKKEHANVELKIEYMDSKAIKYDAVYKKRLFDLYIHKYGDVKFDVIIPSDDNAFNFVREFHEKIFLGTNVVFCGVNNLKAPDLVDRKRFTGILEIAAEKETIELARKLYPKTRRVVIVMDTTPSGNYRWNQLERIFRNFPEIEFIRLDDRYSISEIEEKMRNFGDDTVAIFATLYRDKSGRFISLSEGTSRISEASKQPIFTFHLQVLKYGTIGGKLLGGVHHGQKAAEMALRIIRGEKVQNLPIVKDSLAEYIFDYRQLKRFNIQPSALPKNSRIVNRPFSFYEEYKTLVWTICLFVTALMAIIIFLQMNIVKRKQAEKTVTESQERLLTILDGIDAHIYVADMESYEILFMNEQMKKDFGEGLTGKKCWDVFRNETGPCSNCKYPDLTGSNGRPVGVVVWESLSPVTDRYYMNYDRAVKWVDGRMVKLQVASDITQLKTMEKERQNLEVTLRNQQKLESIGTLAGGVAHEINNPINGIMNYAQLIIDRIEPNTAVTEFASEIIHETQRVATIVRNLLTFAREEKESHSPARIKDIVDAAMSLIRTLILRNQISLEMDIPEDLPKVRCRSQQIQQVIMNLVTNAKDALNEKYSGYDENKKIVIYSSVFKKDERRWIRVTVEDHGPGIDADIKERLFDPFFTTKPKETGTGLGLSISYGIVKDHRGELTFESKVGEYTKFHVDLPVDS